MTAEDIAHAKRLVVDGWTVFGERDEREGLIEHTTDRVVIVVSSEVWWLMYGIRVGMEMGYQHAVEFHRLRSSPAKFSKECVVSWSKREQDVLIRYPRSADGNLWSNWKPVAMIRPHSSFPVN